MTGARVPEGEAAGPLRWGACLLLVLGLHAGVAAMLLRRAPRTELPVLAPDAVVLELAPAAAPTPPDAPSQPVAPVPPDPQPEPPPPVEPPPDVTPPPPEPTPPATPLLPQVPPPSPVEALPTPPPPPAPKRPPPPRPARLPPRPAPASPSRPAPEAPASSAAPRPAPPSASPATALSSSALAGWRSELSSRLQRAKRYPDAAGARDEEGTATVRFTIDRSGHVLSASLAHSSGSDALDEEAVALVRRADPFPPMPPELPDSTYTTIVPVRFTSR